MLASMSQSPHQVFAMPLPQVRDAAFDASKQSAHVFDGSLVNLIIQIVFQCETHEFGAPTAQSSCRTI